MKPLRLGLSSSAFGYVMPPEIMHALIAAVRQSTLPLLDSRQKHILADFMRDIMRVMNSTDIDAMECYHSLLWNNDELLEILLDNAKVEFWSVHAPYGRFSDPSSPDAEIRRAAVKAYQPGIGLAKGLGAGVMVAHPGANVEYDVAKHARLKFAAETLKEIADKAGEDNIRVAVEPLPKQEAGNNLDEVLWMIEQIDRPNVGINFDVNHLFPPEDIPNLIRKAGDRIFSVHISDQDGQERHWLPFKGTLNWQEILTAFVEVGYTGPLVYETHLSEAKSNDDVGQIVVENYKQLISLAPH